MTDRVYPSSKPNGTTTAAATTVAATATVKGGSTHPPPPAAKAQLYNPTRHPYRPQPSRPRPRRSRRSCCCLCFFWSVLLITAVLLLAAIAAAAVYVLYRPHRPTFTVSALRISQFNLTTAASDDTTHLTTALNLTVTAKNPNKKLIFFYDPIGITLISNQVTIANGSFPFFTSNTNNATTIKTQLSTNSQTIDAESVKSLRSDLKRKSGLPLKLQLDTKVIVKMDGLKSKKVGIRVTCEGIHCQPPKGNSTSIASISSAKCKVDLRIKIWKFTF